MALLTQVSFIVILYIIKEFARSVLMLPTQWLTVAACRILTMVKCISPIPQLSQQPTTLAIWDTVSSMETALALVKLMENGLDIHLYVNIR